MNVIIRNRHHIIFVNSICRFLIKVRFILRIGPYRTPPCTLTLLFKPPVRSPLWTASLIQKCKLWGYWGTMGSPTPSYCCLFYGSSFWSFWPNISARKITMYRTFLTSIACSYTYMRNLCVFQFMTAIRALLNSKTCYYAVYIIISAVYTI